MGLEWVDSELAVAGRLARKFQLDEMLSAGDISQETYDRYVARLTDCEIVELVEVEDRRVTTKSG